MVKVGSRETCNPPPTDTDEDYLVLVSNAPDTSSQLQELGFELDTHKYSGMGPLGFISLRFGDLNYIVTEDQDFFDTFLSATYLAKKFNLLDKQDRIDLFDAVFANKSFANKIVPEWSHVSKRVLESAFASSEAEHERLWKPREEKLIAAIKQASIEDPL